MSSTTLDRPRSPAAPLRRRPGVRTPERSRGGSRHAAPRAAVLPAVLPAALPAVLPAVLGRVLGMIVTAAAVTTGLVSEAMAAGTLTLSQVAGSSVGGVATSAVLSSVWAYQDRRRTGAGSAVRTWTGVAFGVGLAHGTWLALVAPGPASELGAGLGTVALTVGLDTLLVAVPALLGVRAAAPAPDAPASGTSGV